MLTPMKMKPVFKEYIWGGTGFRDKFSMETGTETASEAWEVSTNKNGMSIIANGEFEGKTIDDAIAEWKNTLLGDAVYEKYGGKFPLLVKLLDCADKLSVQVHPDDEYANENENGGFGKTEMWYILDAKPDAKLVYGFKSDMTKEMFENAIKSGTLEDTLNYVDVLPDDVFYIEAGTLHALLDGLMVVEIQQNSDTTYRVFDYNRVDKDGKGRELHIEKSLDVTNLSSLSGKEKIKSRAVKVGKGNYESVLVDGEYFSTNKYTIKEKIGFVASKQSFDIIVITKGSARMFFDGGSLAVKAGESVLVPAYQGKYTVEGDCEFLKCNCK